MRSYLLFLCCLLVFHWSSILAAYSIGNQRDTSELSDEELVDKIIAELQERNQQPEIALQVSKDGPTNNLNSSQNWQDTGQVSTSPKRGLNLQVSNHVGEELGQPSSADHHDHNITGHSDSGKIPQQQQDDDGVDSRPASVISQDDKIFIIVVAVAVATALLGIVLAGICYYKLRKSVKAASKVEYPAYGVTGPIREKSPSPGDRKLAQSAQMYHYQHKKQQMIAMERANGYMKHDPSEEDSDDGNTDGDYTVYECPGLAPTGEMEIRNPLFRGEDVPPATPAQELTDQPQGQELEPSSHQEKQE